METSDSQFSNIEEDRISNLPDTLIHHILSFLDMKYVVPTCVLSSRWRYIWTNIPTLNFNSETLPASEPDEFIDFVEKVLLLRDNSDIQRFDLVWYDDCVTESRLNTWMLAALRRNVQELSINLFFDMVFRFPMSLFNCKLLTKLELDMGGEEFSKIVLPNSMWLPRLKFLKLGALSSDDKALTDKFFSSCPILESLIISDTNMNINISSLKLKHFKLDNRGYYHSDDYDDKTVKLCAPNLTSFSCKDYMSQECSLENLSSLVNADIDMILDGDEEGEDPELYQRLPAETKELYAQRMMKFLRVFHNVKNLRLSPGFLEVVAGAPEIFDCQPPQFCNLRCLTLRTWLSNDSMHAINYLLKIYPNIESLFLKITKINHNSGNLGDNWEGGLSLPCNMYHLKFVEVQGVKGGATELKFLEFLLKNAVILEQVSLFSSKADSPARVARLKNFCEKLLTFPRASSGVAILFFQS